MSWFKTLLSGTPKPHACALLLLQREPITFSRDFVLDAIEPAWGRSLSEGHPYWFASGMEGATNSLLSFGGQNAQVFLAGSPEYDEDRATPTLPPVAERAAWPPYAQRLELDTLDPLNKLDPNVRFGITAKMALAFLNENCVGLYDSFHRQFLPAEPSTVAFLQQAAALAPAGDPSPPVGPRLAMTLYCRRRCRWTMQHCATRRRAALAANSLTIRSGTSPAANGHH